MSDFEPPRVTRLDSNLATADGEITQGETTSYAISQLLVAFSERVEGPGGFADDHRR